MPLTAWSKISVVCVLHNIILSILSILSKNSTVSGDGFSPMIEEAQWGVSFNHAGNHITEAV